jgi:hypothetical protein
VRVLAERDGEEHYERGEAYLKRGELLEWQAG